MNQSDFRKGQICVLTDEVSPMWRGKKVQVVSIASGRAHIKIKFLEVPKGNRAWSVGDTQWAREALLRPLKGILSSGERIL